MWPYLKTVPKTNATSRYPNSRGLLLVGHLAERKSSILLVAFVQNFYRDQEEPKVLKKVGKTQLTFKDTTAFFFFLR